MTTKFRTKLETLQAVIQLSEEQAGLNLVNELLADAESLSLLLPREMRVLNMATELYQRTEYNVSNRGAALLAFEKAEAFEKVAQEWNYEN